MSRIYLNDKWGFTEVFTDDLCKVDADVSVLQEVRLPHTCKELPYNYFDESLYQMVSGYRRVLHAPKEWEGKVVYFTCEGAAHEANLYINGTLVATHSCGYTAFTVDISSYLQYGEDNIIVVKVDSRESLNVPPFGFVIDYMTYGGIYRDVYLEVKEPYHIMDVFAKPQIASSNGNAKLVCQMEVSMSQKGLVKGYLKRVDTDACPIRENEAWKEKTLVFEKEITEKNITVEEAVADIHLWDTENPYLYELCVELWDGDTVADSKQIRIGFRDVEFRAEGFYLNGKKFKIRGLNRHQSYPYTGYAMPESMQKFDADILKKELGCNSVRTSHYPQSHYFIDRCDELGLLVFIEIPGWQHIGNEEWKKQACVNVEEMIVQYRNHPSIMIWGVRINESQDDDAFYIETNKIAHALDDTRQTGGVRCIKKSHLYEDVYTYNDFVHNGTTPGCEPKKAITPDVKKGYLVTEYGGHMYPTKAFDSEEHRLEHALRHARVLDAIGKQEDISGSFAWCMFDYNTHKDFGSGDRICYHGVLDMFRNPKLAANVYASQQEEEVVLEVSSSMDIGEHPASNLGSIYIFSNADSVRMYKNDYFIKEYTREHSEFDGMKHGPILVDDFLGDMLVEKEGFSPKQSKMIANALNYCAVHGYQTFPPHILWIMLKSMVLYRMKPADLVSLYTKYVGNWGETATVYKFEAIKDGKVVKTVQKLPMKQLHLEARLSSSVLKEENTYDVALVRIRAVDDNGNQLTFFQEPIEIQTEGPITVVGPKTVSLKGGMGGLYVKTTGEKGKAKITLLNSQVSPVVIELEVI